MKKEVYSIKDIVTGEFAGPWLAKNDGAAIRAFVEGKGKVSSPNDYELYFLGLFNVETGVFVIDAPPQFVTDYLMIEERTKK